MSVLGLLALLICANVSLLESHPRDRIFPGRVKIKITISKTDCPYGGVPFAVGRYYTNQDNEIQDRTSPYSETPLRVCHEPVRSARKGKAL